MKKGCLESLLIFSKLTSHNLHLSIWEEMKNYLNNNINTEKKFGKKLFYLWLIFFTIYVTVIYCTKFTKLPFKKINLNLY